MLCTQHLRIHENAAHFTSSSGLSMEWRVGNLSYEISFVYTSLTPLSDDEYRNVAKCGTCFNRTTLVSPTKRFIFFPTIFFPYNVRSDSHYQLSILECTVLSMLACISIPFNPDSSSRVFVHVSAYYMHYSHTATDLTYFCSATTVDPVSLVRGIPKVTSATLSIHQLHLRYVDICDRELVSKH